MNAPEISTSKTENCTYKSLSIPVSGSIFRFMQVTGELNYICIRKETNNPFKTLGKEFATWEDAEKHYNSANMQIAIFFAASQLQSEN